MPEPKTVFRLVTQADLDANPDLIDEGVSVNQMHDLPPLDEVQEDKPEAKKVVKKKPLLKKKPKR